jgi:hypothetical protein
VGAVEQHDRDAGRFEPACLRVRGGQRDRQHAVEAPADGEGAEDVAPLLGAFDVEQDELVARAGERLGDAAQALDHGGLREEGGDHRDRVRAAGGKRTGHGARLVVEDGDGLQHPAAGVFADGRGAVEHARHRADTHSGFGRHLRDGRARHLSPTSSVEAVPWCQICQADACVSCPAHG